ncbi:bifunctional diguanylate cyclase/phosphodiesterase [Ferrimonas sp. SCSIO 43195]|uniref:putative bifunctional diguanylate cyclase/phosphodiesterase n=1 Tax=Ferrimonas sp. SCSIO 43195 TaxID=2822844 RepID=UPI0020763A82|nr:EAL domain-containing protein [Ferrimonas sp. SCSIO 43195]USD37143.1 EAL domain-containing protein [Ferrimonas sp. SCSIO 43195]
MLTSLSPLPSTADNAPMIAALAQLSVPEQPSEPLFAILHQWLQQQLHAPHFLLIEGEPPQLRYKGSDLDSHSLLADDGLVNYLMKGRSPLNLSQAELVARQMNKQVQLTPPKPQAWLGVPWCDADNGSGAIVVFCTDKHRYSEQDQRLLKQFSGLLKQALHTRSVRQQLQQLRQQQQQVDRQLAQQKTLLSVQHQIASLSRQLLPLDQLCQQFHQQFKRLLPCNNFYVALMDQERRQLQFPYMVDEFQHKLHKRRPLGNGLTEYLLQRAEPLLLDYQQRQALIDEGLAHEIGHCAQSWMGAPLINDDNVIGAVVIQDYHQVGRYSDDDLQMLSYLAQHIANVIIIQQAHRSLSETQQALEGAVNERTQALQHEIAERRRIESQLRHDNLHDHLTGLPNRALLLERLDQLFAQRKRCADFNYALIYLDLDRFKMVNDSLGHLTGDALLMQVSTRLKRCLRGSDTVARLGGDEFAVLLDNLHDSQDAMITAQRIHKMLSQPFLINNEEIYSGGSIGIAYCDDAYNSPQEILRDADVAMYQSKAKGGRQPVVFTGTMRQAAQVRLRLETELARAIEQDQFEIHYQPVWRLDNEQLVGFEALVRWRHPSKGLQLPAQFIEVMEETRQILELDRLVLQKTCQQFADWQRKYPRMARISVSVNLCSEWFSRQNSLDVINSILKETRLPPESLRLEITERSLLGQHEQASIVLKQIRRLGVRLAMDDFGTGYSSLNYLHRLPLDIVKIDRSFTCQVHTEQRARDVVQAIVHLANALNMKVNAEGIDDIRQIEILRNMGCHFGQGFQLGRPMAADNVPAFIAGKNTKS